MAESIGISARGYQQYELAERKPIPEILVALADHFDTSTDYILGRTDNPSPPQK
ncbi:MAG: helix-turn-helix transcriptional regulator [Oscillospiraceae bacterium]|nr:helix-turn-helix transcriptional regulator [Oscillospiraceae bacterium]